MSIRFEDIIPIIINVLKGKQADYKPPITIIRQATGAVSVVADECDVNIAASIAQELHDNLGSYSAGIEGVFLRKSDLFDPALLDAPERIELRALEGKEIDLDDVWLIDRMLTNQEWLLPSPWKSPVPIAVAFSIKGGVGRTFALTVFASYLSSLGKRVALIDLDLEAPGLGVFTDETGATEYGVLDWLVESLVDNASEELSSDYWYKLSDLSYSPERNGAVYCIPASGSRTSEYVSKVGRVFLHTYDKSGEKLITFGTRLQGFIEKLAKSECQPDVILIDSRAGLHDVGSAVIAQLGAEVMLFTRDDPQGWDGYKKLFQYLSHSKQVQYKSENDLRDRMKMVAALLGPTQEDFDHCLSKSYETWRDVLYDAASAEEISTVEKDETASHYPIPIYFNADIRGYHFGETRRLKDTVVKAAFGEFCQQWARRMGVTE